MARALVVIASEAERRKVAHWAMKAPWNTRVEFKGPKRTLPQNDRMWAMLTDISEQKLHCGRRYKPDKWKLIFLHALGQEIEFIPSLDGQTFIPCGGSSSDLSKAEMTQLIEMMFAWGAENGVVFHEPVDRSAAEARAA